MPESKTRAALENFSVNYEEKAVQNGDPIYKAQEEVPDAVYAYMNLGQDDDLKAMASDIGKVLGWDRDNMDRYSNAVDMAYMLGLSKGDYQKSVCILVYATREALQNGDTDLLKQLTDRDFMNDVTSGTESQAVTDLFTELNQRMMDPVYRESQLNRTSARILPPRSGGS